VASRNPFVLCVLAGIATLVPARAQFIQQGDKLIGTGAYGTGFQGISVALSADGNTALVGGYGAFPTGAAWVYTRSGGAWSQQGDRLSGTGAVVPSYQGWSVALSADGNTAVLGAYGDDNFAGAAWVFTRSGGVWSQQGDKLFGTGAVGSARQGESVAISADGNTVAVGASDDNNFVGAAWVFTRAGGVWSQQGGKLVGTVAIGSARQGTSVAVSGDGNTVIVGGSGDNASIGAVWVYIRSNGVWTQQGDKLIGTGYIGTPTQGTSVALSADGNTAIVGGSFDNAGTGAAWVYTRSGGAWSQQGSKLVGTGAVKSPLQGNSVALSADGNTAIVGGPGLPGDRGVGQGVGAAWVYTRSGGVWSQLGNDLFITGAVGVAAQGASVAISGDGNTAMVGDPSDNGYNGAAWVFVKIVSPIPSIVTDGTGVINGGSYLPGDLVSGSWVAIKGDGFTDQTMDWSHSDFSTGFLPATLNGVQVLFNGQPGAIWYLIAGAPQQINVQAPPNLSGNVTVQVIRNGVASNIVTTAAVQVAPAIFPYTLDNGKTFYPSAVFLDGTRLGDPAIFPGARKATVGDHVSLYANSLAPSPAGVVSVYALTDPVTVTIGPATFPADFAGLVAPGAFLINITVPKLPDTANYPVTLEIDGQSSPANIVFPYTN
jgi:uncharacterized protein (TIGR03437 family)